MEFTTNLSGRGNPVHVLAILQDYSPTQISTYNHIIVRVTMLLVEFLWISFFTSLIEFDLTTSGLIDETPRPTAVSMLQGDHNESITRKL
jgi:hypothetical protein